MSAAFAAKIIYRVRGGTSVQRIVPSKGIPADRSRGIVLALFTLRGSDCDDPHLFGALK